MSGLCLGARVRVINTGVFEIELGHLYGAYGRVIGYEPHREVFHNGCVWRVQFADKRAYCFAAWELEVVSDGKPAGETSAESNR